MRNVTVIFLIMTMAAAGFGDEEFTRPGLSLDGAWEFRLDRDNVGEAEGWFNSPVSFPGSIQVPGTWDAQGFGDETRSLSNFIAKRYRRTVRSEIGRAAHFSVLCGGIVGKIWVNGLLVGSHLGYLSDFEFDVS